MLVFILFFLALAVVVFSFQFYSYLDAQHEKPIHTTTDNTTPPHKHVLV